MTSSNFNLRNISPKVMLLLKKKATKQKISLNSLILQLLEEGLDIIQPSEKIIFHDLDSLAGTWTKEDAQEFFEHTKSFEKIDKEMWL